MRIGTFNSMAQIYDTSNLKKSGYTNSTSHASFKDEISLSSIGKDMQVAKNALVGTPDVREDKISDIKSRMSNGTYKVSNEDFAEKLMSSFASKAI